MVREKGLEPSRLAAHAPKACVSTIPPLAHIVVQVTLYLVDQSVTRAKRHACGYPRNMRVKRSAAQADGLAYFLGQGSGLARNALIFLG